MEAGGEFEATTGEKPGGRRLPVLGIACGVLLVICGYVVWAASQPSVEKWCAGVGVMDAPVRDSPEEAFEAWLDSRPDIPSREEWRRSGNEYVNEEAEEHRSPNEPRWENQEPRYDYRSVRVGKVSTSDGAQRRSDDQWTVQGACV